MIKLKKFEDLEEGKIYSRYHKGDWAGRYIGMYNQYLAEFKDCMLIFDDEYCGDEFEETGGRTLLTIHELEFDE